MYYGKLDYEQFWNWLRNLRCKYVFSFDGMSGGIDSTYDVPEDVYSTHKYLKSGKSSFKRIVSGNDALVYESIYIR